MNTTIYIPFSSPFFSKGIFLEDVCAVMFEGCITVFFDCEMVFLDEEISMEGFSSSEISNTSPTSFTCTPAVIDLSTRRVSREDDATLDDF